MNDKLRSDYFLSVGGKLDFGDFVIGENFTDRVTIGNKVLWNSGVNGGWAIESFIERENKGKQPVPDDFPVLIKFECDLGLSLKVCRKPQALRWGKQGTDMDIKSWKPYYEALLKMQAEYDKHNESIVKACDEANKKESEMVYTQEMFDNNIAPKRGMKVLVGGLEPDSRIIDFEGASVTIVNVHSASNLITFSHGLIGCGCGYFSAEKKVFHPIKTPEEIELEEAKKKQIEKMCFKYKNLPLEVAMQMQKNGDFPEIVLDDLNARGMAKQ